MSRDGIDRIGADGGSAAGCERFDEAIALHATGELSGAERDGLLAHLGGCDRCAAELEETRALLAELSADSPRLSPERERTFAARVAGELRAGQAAAARRRRRLLPAAVGALALAAALVIALRPTPEPELALGGGGGSPAPLALPGTPPELSETALADALPEAALLDPLAQLDGPDWDRLARVLDEDPEGGSELEVGAPDLDELSDEELSRLLALLPGS